MEALVQAREQAAEEFIGPLLEVEDLWERKLWHQLTELLLNIFTNQAAKSIRLGLYRDFVLGFRDKINPFHLVKLGLIARQECASVPDALELMQNLAKFTERDDAEEAHTYALTDIAALHLGQQEQEAGRKLLDEAGVTLDKLDTVDRAVHAAYYRTRADYDRADADYTGYYRTTLLYLACVDLSALPADEVQTRAYTIGIAALLGEKVYNFGEFLAHPLVETLDAQDSTRWLRRLLSVMNAGDIDAFDEIMPTAPERLLQDNLPLLREKIHLSALTESIFRRPPHDRVLSFSTIAAETRLPIEQVEFLVMKALSVGLIRGSIDQVAQLVRVSWVQPRVLDKRAVEGVRSRLMEWMETVSGLDRFIAQTATVAQ